MRTHSEEPTIEGAQREIEENHRALEEALQQLQSQVRATSNRAGETLEETRQLLNDARGLMARIGELGKDVTELALSPIEGFASHPAAKIGASFLAGLAVGTWISLSKRGKPLAPAAPEPASDDGVRLASTQEAQLS